MWIRWRSEAPGAAAGPPQERRALEAVAQLQRPLIQRIARLAADLCRQSHRGLQRHLGQQQAQHALAVQAALGDLQKATMWLMQNAMAKPDNAGAASYDYMHLFGRVALGVMWVKIARAALDRKMRDPGAKAWADAKLTMARFYMERMAPETAFRLVRIAAGADTMMSLDAQMF